MLSHEDIELVKALIKENNKNNKDNKPIEQIGAAINSKYVWHMPEDTPPLNTRVEATIEYNGYDGPYRRNSYVYYVPKYCQYEVMGEDHSFGAYNVFCDDDKLYIEPGWYEEPDFMEKVFDDKVIAWRHIETYNG